MRAYGNTNAAPYASAPAVGLAGDTYWNTATKVLYISDGTAWQPATPTAASGDLTGTYPGPAIAAGAVTWAKTSLQSYANVAQGGAAQSIPNGAFTAVTFNTVGSNVGGLYSAGTPDRFTIQQAGIYAAGGSLQIADSAAGNYRVLQLTMGGNPYAMASLVPGSFQCLSVAGLASLSAGAIVQLFILQNSGGALTLPNSNIGPNMWIARVA